ncbi:MAG TPA: DUF3352 domain-containing protein [Gaiellaceae bacterium]|nr:DUF3352 domain-containing protein [Gaiellaceae bacterium]
MRPLRLTAVAVLLLTLVGCGADDKAATSGAEIVPASAPVFVSVDSDLSSKQWQTVDDLLREFPARPQLLAEVRSALRDSGLDYERDVEPALGEEIDLVWLDFASGGDNVVCLTQPKDEEAFRRLIEKGNRSDESEDDLVLGEVEGWTVIADSQAKIDRFRRASGQADKLADEDVFKDAMAELPDDAVVKAYADGQSLAQLLGQALMGLLSGGTDTYDLRMPSESRPEFIAAALAAERDGLRLVGATRAETEPKAQATVYRSKLIDDVPGDAVAFLTFRGNDMYTEQARSSPNYRRSLRELQRLLGGVPLEHLFAIFDGEVAAYVRPGTPFPEVTVLVAVDSDEPTEEEAFQNVDTVMKVLTRFRVAQPCHAPGVEDGVRVACIGFDKIEVRYAGFDKKVVVTTGQSPVAELRARGDKLPDADSFKGAREAAGLPGETTGFLWIDVAKAVPMLLGLAQAAEEPIPPEVRANLEPLKSLLVWGDVDGRTRSFSAFAQID